MSQPVPTIVPTKIRIGDTVKFDLTLNDYPKSEGWGAGLTITKAGLIFLVVNATVVGTVFSFVISTTVTTALAVGTYTATVFVSRATPVESITIQEGPLEV